MPERVRMNDPLAGLPDDARGRLVPAPAPDKPEAMAATLTDARFSDPEWIFERKLDGERCLAWVEGGAARLRSRNDLRLDDTYPDLVDALHEQARADVVVDGEVVAFERGRTSFSRLQQRLGVRSVAEARDRARRVTVYFYLFDVLWCDGYDVRALDLRSRKAVLRRALRFGDPLRFSAHRNCEGEAYYAYACRHGWEGLIAKRASSPYVGKRSRDWLKFKCAAEQELVIGGFTDPQRSRVGFGALLVGYYEDGDLQYAGKVGTGYDTATLVSLRQTLDGLEQPTSQFRGQVRERGAHWVRPELVAQVGFTEWTGDGKLRHPRFLGLRRDKAAADVVRERPS
ncbi:MAG TPA: non-homologous end-joining DNA ligase [Acidimicrobiales bacterium]